MRQDYRIANGSILIGQTQWGWLVLENLAGVVNHGLHASLGEAARSAREHLMPPESAQRLDEIIAVGDQVGWDPEVMQDRFPARALKTSWTSAHPFAESSAAS